MFAKAFTTTVLIAATFAFAPTTATAAVPATPTAPVVISSVTGSGGAL